MGNRLVLLALGSLFTLDGVAGEKGADCRFQRDPAEFLNRSERLRGEIDLRARLMRFGREAARPVAPDSLPSRNFIDQEILGKLTNKSVMAAPLSSDEEFLRRITLDLTGRLPDTDEIRAFVAEKSDTKRDAAIDRLLASPQFVDRWAMWMGDLLQNTATLVNAASNRNAEGRNAFHAYIRDAVSKDKPLSVVAGEVVAAKGNNYDPEAGAANFPMGASTAMGPIQDTYDTMLVRTATTFLGLGHYDCVLCHDGRGHLNQVSAWGTRQTRLGAQGMAAFFSRMSFTPSSPRNSFMVADGTDGGYDLNTNSGNRPDRLRVGSITRVMPGYREAGDAAVEGEWRAAFAAGMVRDPMFARNLANRLWKQMFGLALVDPVDSLDPARLDPSAPPAAPWDLQATHPELLGKLAAELVKQDFKLRSFLRFLTQSTAYQLTSRYDGEWSSDYVPLFARHFARRLEGEEVHDAITKALGTPSDFAVTASPARVTWAMQLPDTIEPASDVVARNFMNTFLRGDRDTQERSQSGSIQQQLVLMNDAFMADRVKVGRSPKLAALAQLKDTELIDEAYLTFLSRRPNDGERGAAAAFLAKAQNRNEAVEDLAWMCINKAEFLFSY